MESTRAERIEAHREKMRNKKARRRKPQQTRLTQRLAEGHRILPNNGNSNRIWPKGKIAKPGRMA